MEQKSPELGQTVFIKRGEKVKMLRRKSSDKPLTVEDARQTNALMSLEERAEKILDKRKEEGKI